MKKKLSNGCTREILALERPDYSVKGSAVKASATCSNSPRMRFHRILHHVAVMTRPCRTGLGPNSLHEILPIGTLYLGKHWLVPSDQQSQLCTEQNHKVKSLLSKVDSGHFWSQAAEAIAEFCTPALCCAVTRWQQVKNMCAGSGELCLWQRQQILRNRPTGLPVEGGHRAITVISIPLSPLRCCHFLPCCLSSRRSPPCLSALVFNSFLFLERLPQGAESKI